MRVSRSEVRRVGVEGRHIAAGDVPLCTACALQFLCRAVSPQAVHPVAHPVPLAAHARSGAVDPRLPSFVPPVWRPHDPSVPQVPYTFPPRQGCAWAQGWQAPLSASPHAQALFGRHRRARGARGARARRARAAPQPQGRAARQAPHPQPSLFPCLRAAAGRQEESRPSSAGWA